DFGTWQKGGQLLGGGGGVADGQLQTGGNRVGGVDDDFALPVVHGVGHISDGVPGGGDDDDVRLFDGAGGGNGRNPLTHLCQQILHLLPLRLPRAKDHRVPLASPTFAQGAAHIPSTNYANFHVTPHKTGRGWRGLTRIFFVFI